MPSVKIFSTFLVSLLIGVILCFTSENSQAQSINVTSVSPSTICAGSDVSVTFEATNGNNNNRRFNNSTNYTIYLSNSSGTSFTSIATFTTAGVSYSTAKNGVTSNIVETITIPSTTVSGAGYKISIGSSGPTFIGSGGTGSSPAFIIKAIPNAPIASNNGPVCEGSTLSLSATTIAGATYLWTGPNNFTSSVQNPIVSTAATSAMAGTYYASASVGGCFSAASATTVTVKPLPQVNLTTSANVVCTGTPITLTATNSGGALTAVTGSNNTSQVISTSGTPTITSNITLGNGILSDLSNLKVDLKIDHTWVGDLKITLQGPGGIGSTVLLDRPGVPASTYGNGDDLINTATYSFSISGAGVIPETTVSGTIPDGIYLPSDDSGMPNNFSGLLTGNNIAGVWTLSITDNFNGDGGNLNSWSITINNASGTYTTAFSGPGTTGSVTYSGINNSIATAIVNPPAGAGNIYTATSSLNGCSTISNSVAIVVNTPGTWLGTINTDYTNSGNWACGTIPDQNLNVTIPAGITNFPLLSATGLSKNLTIQPAASLNVSGGTLKIYGALANSGTFNVSAGTLEFAASTTQTIPAAAFNTNLLKNLTINNAAGVTLNGPLNLSGILKVSTGNFNTNNNLTLLSDATQTASIDGTGAGAVLGNVTMQAYLPSGFGYKFISSPFQSTTVTELADDIALGSTFPVLYSNNENVATAGWVNYSSLSGILNPMEGYAANFGGSAAPKTLTLKGVVNNSTIAKTLFNNNQTYTKGFNLIGNPYPSAIDWNKAGGWIKINVDNAIYFFKASSTDVFGGTYSSYVNGVSSDGGISNNIIPAMQGFFVHVTNGTFPVSGSLTINNTARTTLFPAAKILKEKERLSRNGRLYDTDPEILMIRVRASYKSKNDLSDPAVIYFEDFAKAEFETQLDALKLLNTDASVPNFYSISSDKKNLSINALSLSADSVTHIPLGLNTELSENVEFSIDDLDKIPFRFNIYILDKKQNSLQDMRRDSKFSTYVEKGKSDNRFELILSSKTSSFKIESASSLKANYNQGKLQYSLAGISENQNSKMMISNMSGQILGTQIFRGSGVQQFQVRLNPGIYIINTISEIGSVSKKISVN